MFWISLAVLCTISCASRPKWVTKPPNDKELIYGLGVAQNNNEARAWQAAENRARQGLALQINSILETMQNDYGRVEGTSSSADFFQTVTREMSSAVLHGAEVVRRGTGSRNRYYVLVSYKKTDMRQAVADNARREAAGNTAFQMERALETMDRELAKNRPVPIRERD